MLRKVIIIMGFYITDIQNPSFEDYIGSQTVYSLAEAGVFDCEVPAILVDYCNRHDSVVAIVDGENVNNFIGDVESGSFSGRDVSKLLSLVKEKYKNGFMIIQ